MIQTLLICLLIALAGVLIAATVWNADRSARRAEEVADSEEKTRLMAYRFWEDEGRPDGAQMRHWNKAVLSTAPAKQPSISTSAIEKLQFQSDVAEVQLLLDFISGRPDLALGDPPAAKSDNAGQTATANGTTFNFIPDASLKKMAELRYPPDPRPGKSSEDVAFVLEFRDHLNRLVAPASGLTVAFTLLTWNPVILWIFDQLVSIFWHRSPKENWARWSLANQAYPRLGPSVIAFWISNICVIALAGSVTLVSLWSSHEVADGQARMSRAAALDQQRAQLIVTIEQLNNIVTTAAAPAASTQGSGLPAITAITAPGATVATMLCGRTDARAGDWQKTAPTQAEVEAAQACDDLEGVTKEQWSTYTAMRIWWSGWAHSLVVSTVQRIGDYLTAQRRPDPAKLYPAESEPKDDLFAAPSDSLPTALAGEMSDITKVWLPALYGLVGAVVAALRSIYAKISMSTLAPWDTRLMWTRVILGTLAGTCVGLFFSPNGTTVDGVPGIGNLSLSALAFLAGYAVDGLFAVLDDLIQRVFHGGGGAAAGPGAAKRVGTK